MIRKGLIIFTAVASIIASTIPAFAGGKPITVRWNEAEQRYEVVTDDGIEWGGGGASGGGDVDPYDTDLPSLRFGD